MPALVTSMVSAIPLFHRGLTLVGRVDSSAGMAAAISALADPEERVVYEAPTEYQTCAGLNFYMRRKLTLVRPAGFIPPTYLTPHVDELFITRKQLEQLWQEQRVFLMTTSWCHAPDPTARCQNRSTSSRACTIGGR